MTEDEFFSAVCRGLGWEPTPVRLAMFRAWHVREGMPLEQTWNPLATTRLSEHTLLNMNFDIGWGPGNWNSVHVRVYATPENGIVATIETLALSFYANIRRCFADETVYEEAVPEMATYVGGVAYGQELIDQWKEIMDVNDPRIDELWRRTGGDKGVDFDVIQLINNQNTATMSMLKALIENLRQLANELEKIY